MTDKTKYQWFIEPLDSATNESIARELAEINAVDIIPDLKDNRNKTHKVFRVSHKLVQVFQNSKGQQPLRFKIYNRQGEYGQVREWKFRAKKKSKTLVKAEKDLKNLKTGKN